MPAVAAEIQRPAPRPQAQAHTPRAGASAVGRNQAKQCATDEQFAASILALPALGVEVISAAQPGRKGAKRACVVTRPQKRNVASRPDPAAPVERQGRTVARPDARSNRGVQLACSLKRVTSHTQSGWVSSLTFAAVSIGE